MIQPSSNVRRHILLLGGAGFVGKNLAEALRFSGHSVTVISRSHVAGAICLHLDEVDALITLIKKCQIDTVVHLASTMLPSSTSSDYDAEQISIALPTRQIALRLAALGVRMIYVSSGGTVYGATQQTLASEDDPCGPISFYGQAKLEMESHLRFLARAHGLKYLIIRPSNPFGLHHSLYGTQGLVSVILGKMRDGLSLDVWGDGSSIRDYIYIDDLTASMRALIESEASNMTLNVGSGIGHSLLDVVAIVQEVAGRHIDLNFKPARPADVPHLVLDTSKIRALGMHYSRSMQEGIRTYMDKLGI